MQKTIDVNNYFFHKKTGEELYVSAREYDERLKMWVALIPVFEGTKVFRAVAWDLLATTEEMK